MKRLLLLSPLALSGCMLIGCTSYGNITKNLAKDGAIVVANVGTPWGVQKVVRIGGTTNSVVVSPDGTVSINAGKN